MKKIFSVVMIMLIILSSSINANAMEANNVQIVTNGNTTFLIESNGDVKGWGRNSKGEIGNGTTIDQYTPVTIEGLSNIKEIIPSTYGYGFVFAIDNAGQVFGWGYNGYGQLGLGIYGDVLTPTQITALPPISNIRMNNYTVYAITTEGDVYSTGRNDYGQVGNGTKTTQRVFTQIPQLSGIKDIVCMADVSYAITYDKRVYAWGRGDSWQIGCGEYISAQTTPSKITTLSNVEEIVTNGFTTFAILNNRQEVYSWGESWSGEAGNYSETTATPKRVVIISDLNETVDMLTIVNQTTFAVMSDGTLYGWGRNGSNELGNGGTFDKRKPEIIQNIPKVKQFVFNGFTGILLGVDGCVYVWGKNTYGEAGIGTTGRIAYATRLSTLDNNIGQIFNGYNAMYAVDTNGTLYGWGSNRNRQIAIDDTTGILTPTIIPNISDVMDVEKVNDTAFAYDAQGVIYGWGKNNYGQIGDNTIINVAVPFIVSNNEMTTTEGTGDVNSTVPIVGSINALEISITHPANISYSIDPNSENGFYCSDIQIQNNSKVPVNIRIETFEASSDGDLMFQDVLPSSMDWNGLNTQKTKSYIALGIRYVSTNQWLISIPEMVDPLYAVEIDNTFIGALAKESSAALRLCGYHGLAFDGNYSAKHELVFVVSLL